MYVSSKTLTLAADKNGNCTLDTGVVCGKVVSITYLRATGNDNAYANTANITVLSGLTGQAVFSNENIAATTTWYPTVNTCNAIGVLTTTLQPVTLSGEVLSVKIANAGNGLATGNTGRVHVVWEGPSA